MSLLPLGDETLTRQVLHPPRFKRIYVDEGEGVPFFGGRSLYELVPSGMKYISLAQHRDLVDSLLRVHKNSILITRSGTIGKTVFVPRHWDGWVATDDLIRVIPKDDDIAGYRFTWLNSDYGRTLLERMVYGSVVDHIEEFHVSQMPVPVLPDTEIQRRINDLAVQANERRAEAYDREQEALEKLEGLFDE